MIVKYNIFGYLIGEGFSNVFKNKKSTGASLMIMCATMIIFGIFLIFIAIHEIYTLWKEAKKTKFSKLK